VAKAGDVFIVNREPEAYTTATLPPQLLPLVVQRAGVIELTRRDSDGAFVAHDATITVSALAYHTLTIEVRRLPTPRCLVYLESTMDDR
jgi:hypothetical protein